MRIEDNRDFIGELSRRSTPVVIALEASFCNNVLGP
jgi:hypothetical protein